MTRVLQIGGGKQAPPGTKVMARSLRTSSSLSGLQSAKIISFWRGPAVSVQPLAGKDGAPIIVQYKLDPPTPAVVMPSKPAL